MQTSHSVVDCSSSCEDDDAPPSPVPSVVDVLDTDLDDTKSQTAPSKEIVQTTHSAVDCLSTLEDNDAPPSSDPLVVDVLDRDRDDLGNESSRCMIAYDELSEILSWMPAKSAIKYSSSLCKWSCNMHSEPRFAKKQCIRSCGQDNGFFLQYKLREDQRQVPNRVEFHILPCETASAFGIPRNSLNYLPKFWRILSSSNGLLLLGNTSPTGSCEFKVCNPALREWASVSTPEGFKVLADKKTSPLIECYPWGHDPLDDVEFPNDYTIALPIERQVTLHGIYVYTVSEESKKRELLIYSNGRWDEELCDVSIKGRAVRYDTPVAFFSNATEGLIVHYLCDSCNSSDRDDGVYLEPYIAAFNIREKKLSREIKLPKGAWDNNIAKMYGSSRKKLHIFKWSETSICLVRWFRNISRTVAWVLDDYGCEGESWRLVMSASEMDLWGDYNRDWTLGVGVAGGGKGLLIATAPFRGLDDNVGQSRVPHPIGSRIFLYVVEGEDQWRLDLVGEHDCSWAWSYATFMPYANTLRPVSLQNAVTCTY